MVHIHHEGTCAAPRSVAFGYVDDYRTTTDWMFGLAAFVPTGPKDQGLGSVFDAKFSVKPITLNSTVECSAWQDQELIAFTSIKGFVNRSSWRFVELAAEETKLVVDFEYELPGGLAGKALGRALEPIVALSIRHTDHALRKHIEERYAAR